jgi:hypothetical protein
VICLFGGLFENGQLRLVSPASSFYDNRTHAVCVQIRRSDGNQRLFQRQDAQWLESPQERMALAPARKRILLQSPLENPLACLTGWGCPTPTVPGPSICWMTEKMKTTKRIEVNTTIQHLCCITTTTIILTIAILVMIITRRKRKRTSKVHQRDCWPRMFGFHRMLMLGRNRWDDNLFRKFGQSLKVH